MQSGAEIGHFRDEHKVSLIHLWNKVFGRDDPFYALDLQKLEEILKSPYFDYEGAFVTCISSEVVGFAFGVIGKDRPKEMPGYLSMICVDPAHRRKGIGTHLLNGLWTYMKDRGKSEVEIGPKNPIGFGHGVIDGSPAFGFFATHGFESIPFYPGFESDRIVSCSAI